MKKYFVLVLGFIFVSLFKAKAQEEIDTSDYVRKNICIVDFLIRSLDENRYVRQLYIKDFQNDFSLSPVFTFDNLNFKDDGSGEDVRAGDGIYTSVEIYEHNERISYDPRILIKSISDKSISHIDFLHQDELSEFLESYKAPGVVHSEKKPKVSFSIDCDVSWCSCSNNKCIHCYVPIPPPIGPLRCVGCPNFNNCHVELSLEW